MVNSVKLLAKYKKLARRNEKRAAQLRKKYDKLYGPGKWDPFGSFSEDEFLEMKHSGDQIDFLIKFLGLTKAEASTK